MAATLSVLPASLLVALGGGAGAVMRFHMGRAMLHLAGPNPGFPWGTLSVNLLGSLAMGVLAGWLARSGGNYEMRLLLGVGVLGGFTTFSAFSLEMVVLLERGTPGLAIAYAAASLLAGIAALWLGLMLMRGAA